jgi:hypothetical protein
MCAYKLPSGCTFVGVRILSQDDLPMRLNFAITTGIYLLFNMAATVNAGMSVFNFSFENDGDLTNGPFGTVTVVEGYNSTAAVNTLTFTIDIDQSKLLGTPDIHQFGFQTNFVGTIAFVPKTQVVGYGTNTITLKKLGILDKVSGFGSTRWDYVVDFGNGANPVLDPVTFTVGGVGLSLLALDNQDFAYKNAKTFLGPVSNFAVHVQSTGANRQGSEGLGGYYETSVVPENGNWASALIGVLIGAVIALVRLNQFGVFGKQAVKARVTRDALRAVADSAGLGVCRLRRRRYQRW